MPLLSGPKGEGKSRTEVIFIAGLIFLCVFIFLLRSRHLDRLSLWMDEGFYVLAGQQILHHGYPLYPSGHILFKGILYSYLLALFGWLFGPSVTTLRLISVVASVLVLPFFYLLARKVLNPTLAFIGLVILAFSSWQTEYSRVAIYFPLLQLVYLACLYFFHLTYLEEKKKYLIPTVILFLLAPHVHQLAMGTLFSFVAIFFIFGLRRFFRRDVILPLIIIAISYLSLQLHELFFWKVGHVYEKESMALKEALSYFFQGFTPAYFREILLSFPHLGLVVFFGLFLYLGLRLGHRFSTIKEKAYLDRWFFLNVNFFLPLVFFGFFRTHIQPRYLFQLQPLLILLFLVAVKEIGRAASALILYPFSATNKQWLQKTLTAILCFVFIINFSDQVGWRTTQRIVNRDYKDRITTDIITRSGRTEHYDYRGVGLYIRHYLQPDDLVIAMHMVFQYIYGGKVDYWLWTGGPGTWDAWEKTPDGWKDIYIGARWLNSLEALREVIANRGRHRLWLITSPSIFRRDHISSDIADFILGQKNHLLFRGRDEMSEVYLWEGEEKIIRQPAWEAEWLPASIGEVNFDPSASRGSYLRFAGLKMKVGQKTVSWKNELPSGAYNLRIALRTKANETSGRPSRLELSLQTKKTRLVVFSKIIYSRDLPANGQWITLSSPIILPQAEEFWLTVGYQGEKTIDWDYLDFLPVDNQKIIASKQSTHLPHKGENH